MSNKNEQNSSSGGAQTNWMVELQTLKNLLDSGALNQVEFEEENRKILSRVRAKPKWKKLSRKDGSNSRHVA